MSSEQKLIYKIVESLMSLEEDISNRESDVGLLMT